MAVCDNVLLAGPSRRHSYSILWNSCFISTSFSIKDTRMHPFYDIPSLDLYTLAHHVVNPEHICYLKATGNN